VKGHRFVSTEDIRRSVTQALNNIPRNALQECYKQLQHRWKSCVQAQGMYFESYHFVVDEYIKLNFFFGTSLITLLSDLVQLQCLGGRYIFNDNCVLNVLSDYKHRGIL
jgi:hypothetical protein